tara:strand:- start:1922 stop:2134 length:213 start_codon:yes stop_codon:yes gene_type:complete
MNKTKKRAEAMFDILLHGECVTSDETQWYCYEDECFKQNEELIYDHKDVQFAFKMLRNFVWQYRKKHNIK